MATLESPHTFTGPGWISPNEVQGSTQPRIGGGRQGGVPVRNNFRGNDISALTDQVWSKVSVSPFWSSSSSSSSQLSSNNNNNNAATTQFGDARRYNFNTSTFICRSLSECEPCPSSKRNHPFCRPYGNRRLVACRNMLDSGASSGSGSVQENLPKPFQSVVRPAMDAPPTELEFQGWEACGKVVAVETRDYLEFVVILILLALSALWLLIKRNRQLVRQSQDAEIASTTNRATASSSSSRTRRARLG